MKKYISIFLTVLAVAGSSCKKTFLSELAASPNTPASTSAALQLTGALTQTATIVNGTANTLYLYWDGYGAYSTNFQPSAAYLLYSITTDTFDNFTRNYLNISNYSAVFTSTTEPYYTAIAKIMIAHDYQMLVDQYNNVPYTQSIQGAANLTPGYDTGSAIYDDLIKQLDAAINLIKNAPATASFPGKNDLMFKATNAAGMAKWCAFANTLKLRLAVHQSSNPTLLASKKALLSASLAATASYGYITTAAEGAINPGYTNTDNLEAPLDLAYGYLASGAKTGNNTTTQANTFYVNSLIGTGTPLAPSDPRLFKVFAPSTTPAANGQIAGTALGQTQPPTVGGVQVTPSIFTSFVLDPTKSAIIISASEAFFLQAEAIKAGILTGTVADEQTAYNAGVTASFTELGLTAAQATAYLALPAYTYPVAGTSEQREAAIIYQKWVSFNPYNTLEAYTELRRTGYPAVPLSILPGVTATTYVQRLPYPTIEYNTNGVNANAQGTSGTDIYSPIFWHK